MGRQLAVRRVPRIVGALVVLLALFSFVSVAHAITEPPEYWVHLEDGNYGFENEHHKIIDQYTPAEKEVIDRRVTELSADVSDAEVSASNVEGYKASDGAFVTKTYENLDTGKPYGTPGEWEVGDELGEVGESEGFLPSLTDVIGAVGDAGAVVGAGYLGVKIGEGIDDIFGLPTFSSIEEGSGSEGEHVHWEYRKFEWERFQVDNVPDTSVKCKSWGPVGRELQDGGVCMGVASEWAGEGRQVDGEGDPVSSWYEFSGRYGPEYGPVTSKNQVGESYPIFLPFGGVKYFKEGDEAATYIQVEDYKEALDARDECLADQPPIAETATPCELPAVHPATTPTFTPAEKEVEKPRRPHVPIPDIDTTEIAAPLPAYVTHESTDLKPVEGPAPENPTLPEILPVEHDELYTHYRERLESEGLTNIQEHVLPEISINPDVGPNEVSSVSPATGTKVSPDTEVNIDVNPDNAPVPEESTSHVGPPSEPGFNLPRFGVVCKGFPFGVPCWLAKVVESWSQTSEPPEWGINGFNVRGKKIEGAKFKLAVLEPVMEVLRPTMVAFATIGLVLLFYKFAKGGGPPSGGGSESLEGNED
jgi:hypothetical protein